MSEWARSVLQPHEAHVCNCIGCCEKCGGCRTNPQHTDALCELAQRYQREAASIPKEET